MAQDNNSEREHRRFIRLDLPEDVRALDSAGRDIGRVEKVSAGGMQIRLSDDVPEDQYGPGLQMDLCVVEPGNVRNKFKVEVRGRDGKTLGVQFLT